MGVRIIEPFRSSDDIKLSAYAWPHGTVAKAEPVAQDKKCMYADISGRLQANRRFCEKPKGGVQTIKGTCREVADHSLVGGRQDGRDKLGKHRPGVT
ncbi:hypothetical protein PoB_007083100 [Plakobranchus ocellatus]|uniref:Uncharacterized protein n=1 Tax=Plakobranchus ocellatus TaxID=259542 RepID=A0AAV4DKC6_9GAST|nr:hypothetical protein PoB_007083100 [Plakobranchus ocellatus]